MPAEAGRISIDALMAGVPETSDPEMAGAVPGEITIIQTMIRTIVQLANDILSLPFNLWGTTVPRFLFIVALHC